MGKTLDDAAEQEEIPPGVVGLRNLGQDTSWQSRACACSDEDCLSGTLTNIKTKTPATLPCLALDMSLLSSVCV